MGGVVGKAANDVGGFIGNAFAAPFKSILGRSCKDVCSGPWDITCFIEHFCISDLAKLVMISGLCFIVLMFFYLLFKLGVCQCIVKSLCKMSCAACEVYWCTTADMTRFLWHKLKNTKRVHRGRRRLRDIEANADYSSSDEHDFSDRHRPVRIRRKRSREEEKIAGESRSHHRCRHDHSRNRSRSRNIKLRSRGASLRLGEKSRIGRKARKIQLPKGPNTRRRVTSIKKRRVK